jgi:2-polyprenyl-3-methyl-5-hydroxy-6-metoxy-1,4-benzoquinol methylase
MSDLLVRQRIEYFADSLWKRLRGVDCACPNCGSTRFAIVDRKYIITELRRCEGCRLMYRAPSDDQTENEEFYQEKYSQGFTTELPDEAEIEELLAKNFATPKHSYSYAISLLKALGLGRGRRVFDYGCSWGYGSWQMRQSGMDVVAFEISRLRSEFARKRLGLNMVSQVPAPSNLGELAGSFDCFFSSHVVEHVPRPAAVIELAQALLKPGGYFLAITPNGSDLYRRAAPLNWHLAWGKVHPNMIDDEYWQHALAPRAMMLATSPVDHGLVRAFRDGANPCQAVLLDGAELVCIARY